MSSERPESLDNERSTERLEAFSDGVIAVAITLLVLNIQVPERTGSRTLIEALFAQWPTYLGYFTSFVVIGLFWMNHHYMFRYIKRTTHFLLALNTLTLMFLALIPFATAFITKEVQLPNAPQEDILLAAFVYGGSMLFTSIMYNVLWGYAASGRRLIDPSLSQSVLQRMTRRYLLSIPLYLLTLLLSIVSVRISFLCYLLIALFYALPAGNLSLRKRQRPADEAAD